MTNTVNITGRSAFLSLLEQEGVTHLFGNPGTTELPIMDAIPDHPDLKYVLGMQEALVVAMADGYARASGRLAACNVHVAPGLGNAMGSLYNAKWYGSPLILTAGQQEQGHGLTEPMLYDPLVPIASPLVKWAVEVTRLDDLPRIVHRAAKVALTAPTGPVFISLPGDILNDQAELDLGSPSRVDTTSRPTDEVLETLASRILAAEAPMIVSGHEVATHHAFEEAERLAESLGAPVYQQTVPYAAHYRSEHPNFVGALSRNQQLVRQVVAEHDLMICLGADVLRMSVWSPVDPLPPETDVVQIGLRDWEMGKNYPTELAVRADVKTTLAALAPAVERLQSDQHRKRARASNTAIVEKNWSSLRSQRRQQLQIDQRTPIDPAVLMHELSEAIPADAVVVDEGLVSTRPLLNFLPLRDPQSYYGLASGGIGFAMAGAIGIQLALPHRPVVAVIGDGSAMYSIQSLWTAANLELPITYVIANNRSYRILKERLVEFHDNRRFVGMDFHLPQIDFPRLAESLGVAATRVDRAGDVRSAVNEAIATGKPSLIDVAVDDGFGNQPT